MRNPVLKDPRPDFEAFARVIRGEEEPDRVYLAELGMDHEIQEQIFERFLGTPRIPCTAETREGFFRQHVEINFRLGYHSVPTWPEWPAHPAARSRETADTAALARGKRIWVEEGRGLITSWEEFERFPWDALRHGTGPSDLAARHLPQGMKLTVGCTLFEHVIERLLGFEGLFYLLHDDEELVGQVFHRWGRKVYDYYADVVRRDEVGAVWHADDLGFKTSTLISPKDLRRHVFPWYRKYADLAHEAGKLFLYHGCGNIYPEVIEVLIEEVGIDGFHSFEDVILPVTEFKARYGDRVAALGGVDMDKLSRMDPAGLAEYVQEILDRCMPGGRFAVGAGNSVANYVPLENYLTVLETARAWKP